MGNLEQSNSPAQQDVTQSSSTASEHSGKINRAAWSWCKVHFRFYVKNHCISVPLKLGSCSMRKPWEGAVKGNTSYSVWAGADEHRSPTPIDPCQLFLLNSSAPRRSFPFGSHFSSAVNHSCSLGAVTTKLTMVSK